MAIEMTEHAPLQALDQTSVEQGSITSNFPNLVVLLFAHPKPPYSPAQFRRWGKAVP